MGISAHDVTTTFREQFYCRDCGYVPEWRQIENVKDPQGKRHNSWS